MCQLAALWKYAAWSLVHWHIGILPHYSIILHIIFAFYKKGLTLLALISCRYGNSERKRYGKTDIYGIS
jgi:hypothetical protein